MPLVCIDASYVVFHTYHTIKRSSKRRHRDVILKQFEDLFIKRVNEIIKNALVKDSNVIIVVDCPRSCIWRNDLHPEYKQSRKSSADFDAKAFTVLKESILPSLIDRGMCVLQTNRAEADDLAGCVVRWKSEHNPEWRVILVTGDNDYVQLCDEWTSIIDPCGRDSTVANSPDFLTIKILCGDKSDNIPPVKPRMGPKTAETTVSNKGRLDQLLKDEHVNDKFILNTKLIDLRHTPSYIMDYVHDALKVDSRHLTDTSAVENGS